MKKMMILGVIHLSTTLLFAVNKEESPMKIRLIRFSVILTAATLIWSGTVLAGNPYFSCEKLQNLPVPGFVLDLLDCGCAEPPCL